MSTPEQRQQILTLVDEATAAGAGREKACAVIGIASSTLRRWRPTTGHGIRRDGRPAAIRPIPSNRYTEAERDLIVDTCNSERYASLPPTQIVPALADEGHYIGSESTFYRVLKERGQLNARGRSKARVKRASPTTHVATAPNQIWMMDVTWLPSRVRGRFFYLYLVEDLYSRFGVHWEVFDEEHSEHTKTVVEQAMWREKCLLAPPILHSDNGSVLKAQTVQRKLQEMGITPSHSRPRVSNDNAFVESFFRSLKYCPMWPSQGFMTIEDARDWVQQYMTWYNHEHRHSAVKFVTPAQRHAGDDVEILAKRRVVYEQARTDRPDRWRGKTRNWEHGREVALNPDRQAQVTY